MCSWITGGTSGVISLVEVPPVCPSVPEHVPGPTSKFQCSWVYTRSTSVLNSVPGPTSILQCSWVYVWLHQHVPVLLGAYLVCVCSIRLHQHVQWTVYSPVLPPNMSLKQSQPMCGCWGATDIQKAVLDPTIMFLGCLAANGMSKLLPVDPECSQIYLTCSFFNPT